MRRLAIILVALAAVAACSSSNKQALTIDSGTIDARGNGIDAPPGGADATPTIDAPPGPPDSSMMSMIDAGGPSCGTCPSGTSCGTMNGLPVCKTSTGIPILSHVFVIVMENTSQSTLASSTNTPYLHSLFSTYASASDYHGVAHPSLPNYLVMTSGEDVSSVACDCSPLAGTACTTGFGGNCNQFSSNCGCPQTAMHLGDQLEAAGLTWKDYGEDMGTPCNTTAAGSYAPKHVPFLYYTNVQSDMPRCTAHVVPYTQFAGDLATAPNYSLIAPNLTNDMHDPVGGGAGNLANGDAWLMANVPPILASSAYTNGGLLVIVWDEDDLSGLFAPDDPIPMIVMSPYAKHGGFVSSVHADHHSLLGTIEDGLGLPRLVPGATALADYFPSM